MIEQTVPLRELVAGMARCVREWILPHLDDPMARTQAELLATLLDGLPAAFAPEAARAIARDSDAARALLAEFAAAAHAAGEPTEPSVAAAMRENAALKEALVSLAEAARRDGTRESRERLARLQRFFVASATGELPGNDQGTDFASMSQRDIGEGGGAQPTEGTTR